ncbi:MAG TPA: hypothetical protein VNM37_08195, partial [Candidatus Dormibacteraeota bacterium]|nr:hypothetical protein [Candidatus Dormibacteraeota bacterium]
KHHLEAATQVDAKKQTQTEKDALALARDVDEIYAAKGKQVEVHNLFAFGGVDLFHVPGQSQGILLGLGLLFRVHLSGRFEVMFRKKLLRSAAAGSAGSMITPINFGHRLGQSAES